MARMTTYEIRIRGRLSDTLLGLFSELRPEVHEVETVLVGRLPDQCALHGMLHRIQQHGLELIEVRRLPAATETL